MDTSMMAVAEELAGEFRGTEPSVVMHVVCACVDDFPEVDPLFIEQASRARLNQGRGGLGDHDESPRRP